MRAFEWRGGQEEKNDADNGNRDSAGSEKMAMTIQTDSDGQTSRFYKASA